ncbi:GNAT family N-acetyltransferase [Kineosporia rhizophila]|uniref:GNAT family N-acetyltransferase n=1 Tax=Kineosporia rhizophila TaxID=84633 RepID=UPI001E5DBD11|nr:GNAT family N-acetyltransferase [Kineosporia rhizophila]MCE0537466.1 GNAT family N-acetyltransferase [Kineosporia rhizophila]
MHIRLARPDDLPLLPDVERAAGESFRAIGMPQIADDEPLSLEELAAYQEHGRAWVAEWDHPADLRTSVGTDSVAAVAYLLMDVVDERWHIEQVTVHPRAARRGVGAALIEHLAREAAGTALTLTTFADVPWNAPYYRRLGFTDFAEPGPELRRIRRREAELGLDRWPRLCMIRTK